MEKSTISILTRPVKNCIVLDMIKITRTGNEFNDIRAALNIIKSDINERPSGWIDFQVWGVRIRFFGKILVNPSLDKI